MAGSYKAGIVTAYGAAVRGGYTGTYEEFCRQQAGYAENTRRVEELAEQAQEILDSIPEDYTQMSEDVDTLKADTSTLKEDLFNTLVTDTATGAIASFSDGADNVPVKSLTVDIEPVQSGSGDPSPTNVRPISGHTQAKVTRTGANLFDEASATIYGRYFRDIGNNTNVWSPSNDSASYAYKCKPNTTYVVSCDNTSITVFRVGYIDVDPDTITSSDEPTLFGVDKKTASGATTITTGANAKAIVVQTTKAITQTRTTKTQISTIATAYEPYTADTYTIDLDGTIYGGTLDVTTGVLTVDSKELTINSSDGFELYDIGSNTTVFKKPNAVNENIIENGEISNILKFHVSAYMAQDGRENTFVLGASKSLFIQMPNTVASTIAELNTFISSNPVTVVYKLATPQTIQLTAQEVRTLLGTNNVFADAGDLSVEYRADTKLYIQKVLNA